VPSRPAERFDVLSEWCLRVLGAAAEGELFRTSHLSTVVGLRLVDAREVVVKIRPREGRMAGCVAVHKALWRAGYPCAQPLTDALEFGPDTVISAEALVSDGDALDVAAPSPKECAAALARLITLAPDPGTVPSLAPAPPWVGWDHPENGVWPLPDDRDADLNAVPGPSWLDDGAARVRARLCRYQAPVVIGHADWEAQNVFWRNSRLHVVHDWDSAVSLPEATIAGAAAAVYAVRGERGGFATVTRTEEFLDAYEDAVETTWTEDDRQAAWAAGLWVLSFNAKKATVDPSEAHRTDRLASEMTERLDRAGA